MFEDKTKRLNIIPDNPKHSSVNMVYGNGLFVSSQNTDNVIPNWISGRYSRLKVRLGWLPLHPTEYVKRDCYNKIGYKLLKMAWKVPQLISAKLHKNRPLNQEQNDKYFSKEIVHAK